MSFDLLTLKDYSDDYLMTKLDDINDIGGTLAFTPEIDKYGITIKHPIVSNNKFFK